VKNDSNSRGSCSGWNARTGIGDRDFDATIDPRGFAEDHATRRRLHAVVVTELLERLGVEPPCIET